uniref:Uncharacterized protein n=1 Tax=Cannabis sativa TaxID=3483 RepID=A0A803NU43_CANSA
MNHRGISSYQHTFVNIGKSSADLFQGFRDFVRTSIACYYAKDAFSHGRSKLREKKLIILAPLSEYRIKIAIDESLRWCDINKQNFIQIVINQCWYDLRFPGEELYAI